MEKNYFQTLNDINVNDKTEKKNGLTYLSWSYAWAEVKKLFPDTTYTIYENADGWNYFSDGRTCWVKTGVTCNGIEHIEYLPVMDFRNQSIPAAKVTSFDVNKTIQRSLTKALARHGIGLYVYAGEDLPEEEAAAKSAPAPRGKAPAKPDPAPENSIDPDYANKVLETVQAMCCGIHDAESANETLVSIKALKLPSALNKSVNEILMQTTAKLGLYYSGTARSYVQKG